MDEGSTLVISQNSDDLLNGQVLQNSPTERESFNTRMWGGPEPGCKGIRAMVFPLTQQTSQHLSSSRCNRTWCDHPVPTSSTLASVPLRELTGPLLYLLLSLLVIRVPGLR